MAAPTNAATSQKVLANAEPSTHGPSRRLVAMQQFCRFRSEADMQRGLGRGALAYLQNLDLQRTG
jgi:hypothetical protein